MANLSIDEENVQDFQFILDEVFRYAKNYYNWQNFDATQEFIAGEPPMSFLYQMPCGFRPERKIVIGVHAHNRFFKIARRIKTPRKDKRIREVDESQLVEEMKKSFAFFIFDKKLEINQNNSRKIISSAFKRAIERNKQTTYYFPCVFFKDFGDEVFSVGEVTVCATKRFIEQNINTPEFIDKNKNWLNVADVKNYYEHSNAVICVTVAACSEELSQQRAIKAARILLGIFQLFSRRQDSFKIKLLPYINPLNQKYNLIKQGDILSVSISGDYDGRNAKEWRKLVDWDNLETSDFLNVYTLSINKILSPPKQEILSSRLIDAILWFSEAIYDNSVYSRIVKYVTAIERLTTVDDKKVSKKVEDRASKLISIFWGERAVWRERIKNLYDLRSNIVHGSLSLTDTDEDPHDYWAEKISQKVILAATRIFHDYGIHHRNITTKSLKQFYEHIESIPDNPRTS